MLANYCCDVDAATFIVSQGHLPEVQTPVTFTTYAPLATFGGTPSAKGNVTLEVMQPSAASGCEPFSMWSKQQTKGRVLFLIRGGCNFIEKARRAQEAGAKGVVIGNMYHDDGEGDNPPDAGPVNMFGIASDITIPVVMVSSQTSMKLTEYLLEIRKIRVQLSISTPPKGCATSDDMYKNPLQCIEGSAEVGEATAVKGKNDDLPEEKLRLPLKSWMASRSVVSGNEAWMTTMLMAIYFCLVLYYIIKILHLQYSVYVGEAREDEGALDHIHDLSRTMHFLRIVLVPLLANAYILFSRQLMSTSVVPATIRRLNASMFFWIFLLNVQLYETTTPSNIYFFPASKNLHEENLLRCCGEKPKRGIAPLKLFSAIVVILISIDAGYVGFGGRGNDVLETLGWMSCTSFGFIWLFVLIQTCRFLADVIKQRHRQLLSPNAELILKMRQRAFYTVITLSWVLISMFGEFMCMLLLNVRSMMDMPGEWMVTNFVLCLCQAIHLLCICFGPLRDATIIALFLQNTTDRQLRVSSVRYMLAKHKYFDMSENEKNMYPQNVAAI